MHADLEERAERQPHLDVLHLLQTEVRDFRLLGFPRGRDVAEQLGKQEPLSEGNRVKIHESKQPIIQHSRGAALHEHHRGDHHRRSEETALLCSTCAVCPF